MNITISQVWNGTLRNIPHPEPDKTKLNAINEEWASFKVWCLEKKKSPNHGASVREYCQEHKEMIS